MSKRAEANRHKQWVRRGSHEQRVAAAVERDMAAMSGIMRRTQPVFEAVFGAMLNSRGAGLCGPRRGDVQG